MMITRTGTELAVVLRREADKQEDAIARLGLHSSKLLLKLHEVLSADEYALLQDLLTYEREQYNRCGFRDGLRTAADIIEEDY